MEFRIFGYKSSAMFDNFDAKQESERIISVVSEILIEEKKKYETNVKNSRDNNSRPTISIVADNV